MKVGGPVRMTEGPFLGMYGTVVSSSGDRAGLAVDLGCRKVQVEIPRDWLVKVTPRRPSMPDVKDLKSNRRKRG